MQDRRFDADRRGLRLLWRARRRGCFTTSLLAGSLELAGLAGPGVAALAGLGAAAGATGVGAVGVGAAAGAGVGAAVTAWGLPWRGLAGDWWPVC